ncbi:MAG: hypothetical protein PHQ20_00990 [Candidatus Moranbacteria bacterium]|jgi:hypothetical protein|nr:hypothetical protein [Candidatus Moranbacteria bacterium]
MIKVIANNLDDFRKKVISEMSAVVVFDGENYRNYGEPKADPDDLKKLESGARLCNKGRDVRIVSLA